jgi:tRNA A22 N-methylase
MHKYDVECECVVCVAWTDRIGHRLETVATYVDNSGHDYDIECECTECQKITVAEREIQMYVLGEPISVPVTINPEVQEFADKKLSDGIRFDQH